MACDVIHDLTALRARARHWRSSGERVALVPTMGALHEGHLALIRHGKHIADRCIVSIYVNPKQFAPTEDFETYPRTFETDRITAERAGADLIWAPDTAAMYPDGFTTSIMLQGPALGLESDARPHFFTGVATVCTKLFLQTTPHVAIFGEKDFQQLAVIRTIVRDLNIDLTIVGHETVREVDGLALSSRNAYLSSEHREIAPLMYRTLQDTAVSVAQGEPIETIEKAAQQRLLDGGFESVDYVEIRDPETLTPPNLEAFQAGSDLRILAAAMLGETRLIDNVSVRFEAKKNTPR